MTMFGLFFCQWLNFALVFYSVLVDENWVAKGISGSPAMFANYCNIAHENSLCRILLDGFWGPVFRYCKLYFQWSKMPFRSQNQQFGSGSLNTVCFCRQCESCDTALLNPPGQMLQYGTHRRNVNFPHVHSSVENCAVCLRIVKCSRQLWQPCDLQRRFLLCTASYKVCCRNLTWEAWWQQIIFAD